MTLQEHWDALFHAKADPELGWYEGDVSRTLAFLDGLDLGSRPTTVVPGAGTSLLVDALFARGHRLVLNDLSGVALDRLRRRIGPGGDVTWLHQSISLPLPSTTPAADLWVDRAVLHFLVDPADVAGYAANVRRVVRPGGYVLLAQFSEHGATRCAGLEVRRYTAAALAECLGPMFTLRRQEEHVYRNPRGDPRPYVYALFQRSED